MDVIVKLRQLATELTTLAAAAGRGERPDPPLVNLYRLLGEVTCRFAQLQLVADQSSDVISVHDRDGVIRYVTPSCKDLTGYSADELTQIHPQQLFYDEQLNGLSSHIERLIESHSEVTTVFRIRKKCGGVVRVESRLRGVRNPELGECLVVVSRDWCRNDSDELKRIRDQLVRSTSLATIGGVSAQIAHELRNPLGAIRNAAFLARNRMDPADDSYDCIELIEQETSSCQQIINTLLDTTRLCAPDPVAVALLPVLNRVINKLGGQGQIRFHLAVDPAATVNADPTQLQQVLDNLLSNAKDAVGERGSISVGLRHETDRDVILIADTGVGVREADREVIFEPLYTSKAKGTGLGLSICRQVIERHGGLIRLDNPAHPTRFRLELPRLAQENLISQNNRDEATENFDR